MNKRSALGAAGVAAVAVIAAVVSVAIRGSSDETTAGSATPLVILTAPRGGPVQADSTVDVPVDVYTTAGSSAVTVDRIELLADGEKVADAEPHKTADGTTATIAWTPAVPTTHILQAVAHFGGKQTRSTEVGVRVVPPTIGQAGPVTGGTPTSSGENDEGTRPANALLVSDGSPPSDIAATAYPPNVKLPAGVDPVESPSPPVQVDLAPPGPDNQGEPVGDDTGTDQMPTPEPGGSLSLVGAQLTLDAPATQVYCYAQVGDGLHARVPESPGDFLDAVGTDGKVWDLGSALGALVLDDRAEATVTLDCWGWRDGKVAQLGTITTEVGKGLKTPVLTAKAPGLSLAALQLAQGAGPSIPQVKPPTVTGGDLPKGEGTIPAPTGFQMTPLPIPTSPGNVVMSWIWHPKSVFPGDPPDTWVNDIDGLRFVGLDGHQLWNWPTTSKFPGETTVVDATSGVAVPGMSSNPAAACGWIEAYKGAETSARSNIACWPGYLPETKTGPEIVKAPSSVYQVTTAEQCTKLMSPDGELVATALCKLAFKTNLPVIGWSGDPFGCVTKDGEPTTPKCPYREPDGFRVYTAGFPPQVEITRTTNHADQHAMILPETMWGSCVTVRGSHADLVSVAASPECLPAKPVSASTAKPITAPMIQHFTYTKDMVENECPGGGVSSPVGTHWAASAPVSEAVVSVSVDEPDSLCGGHVRSVGGQLFVYDLSTIPKNADIISATWDIDVNAHDTSLESGRGAGPCGAWIGVDTKAAWLNGVPSMKRYLADTSGLKLPTPGQYGVVGEGVYNVRAQLEEALASKSAALGRTFRIAIDPGDFNTGDDEGWCNTFYGRFDLHITYQGGL